MFISISAPRDPRKWVPIVPMHKNCTNNQLVFFITMRIPLPATVAHKLPPATINMFSFSTTGSLIFTVVCLISIICPLILHYKLSHFPLQVLSISTTGSLIFTVVSLISTKRSFYYKFSHLSLQVLSFARSFLSFPLNLPSLSTTSSLIF